MGRLSPVSDKDSIITMTDVDPYKRLAAGVIAQAANDAAVRAFFRPKKDETAEQKQQRLAKQRRLATFRAEAYDWIAAGDGIEWIRYITPSHHQPEEVRDLLLDEIDTVRSEQWADVSARKATP